MSSFVSLEAQQQQQQQQQQYQMVRGEVSLRAYWLIGLRVVAGFLSRGVPFIAGRYVVSVRRADGRTVGRTVGRADGRTGRKHTD